MEEDINYNEQYIIENHENIQKTINETMRILIKNKVDLNFKRYYLSLLEQTINDYETWLVK
ncbi:hypothetical protein VC03_02720 [Sneathia vaginalis]|uniref:Uncharacterized protein n=1 Tax=Sneathia vaginalis TaxID=187101 RepID=A0A0E3ZA74_9FUSO|nr:hypothetical protein VC03_02720 [Sneathia vaginalis]